MNNYLAKDLTESQKDSIISMMRSHIELPYFKNLFQSINELNESWTESGNMGDFAPANIQFELYIDNEITKYHGTDELCDYGFETLFNKDIYTSDDAFDIETWYRIQMESFIECVLTTISKLQKLQFNLDEGVLAL